ncbi:MAG: serine/threonine-protein kinase [Polyangiaceae bacterium]
MECLACHTPNLDGARFCLKCGAPLPASQAAEADPLIGKVIASRYRITGILGEGGMGRVYTGEQQMGTSVRKVAVKTLLSQFAKDPQTVARFMREVGTVSELEHPNTIKVYDFGQIEGSGDLYIAMELLAGKTLEDELAHAGAMSPERVDRIIGQVCGSLQEAHDKGIVHRDLKPANIFLTTRAGEEDVVKVLDFGIAKKGDQKDGPKGTKEQKLTQQGTILGTPPYMSPEQFTAKELDARSDLYSLAILTYEALTGRLPFEAETPWQWMNQHLSVPPLPFENTPAGANVPHKMKMAVLRALEKDRERRPSNAREFYEELTLGAVRMSLLAAHSGSSPNIVPQGGGTMAIQNPGAPHARPGGTQIGEPLPQMGAPHAGGGGGAGKTMMGDPMPQMHFGAQPGVPTGGGQVYAMPPQQPAKKGGGGIIIAILAVAAIGGGGFAGWYFLAGPGKKAAATDDGVAAETTGGAGEEPTSKSGSTSGGKAGGDAASSSGGTQANASTTGGTADASTSGGDTDASGSSGSSGAGSSSSSGGGTTSSSSSGGGVVPHPSQKPVSHDTSCCNGLKQPKLRLCQGAQAAGNSAQANAMGGRGCR